MTASRVVVAGAGPAGAALSYLLARRGVEVTLVERQTDFAREFRGEVLMPSGIDAFTQMGLGREFASLPQRAVTRVEIYLGARPLFDAEIPRAAIDAGGVRIVSQPAMLEMLAAQASRFPTFRLLRGATVRDLLTTAGRVSGVRIDSSDGPIELGADLVVGTDGRSSVVRKRSGLDEERTPQSFDIVWAKLPLPPFLADGTTARVHLGQRHFTLAFPSYDGRLQIGWVIAKGSFGALRQTGIAGWIETMSAHVSPDLAAHLRACRDAVSHPFLLDVMCDRLVRWTAPGLCLLGDAAHPMSPVGGQGINIALRDALVAANHLCPLLAGGAGHAEIDDAAARVAVERLREVSVIQRLQQAPPEILFGDSWWSRVLVARLLPLLFRTGVAPLFLAATFRRFANGVTTVRLEA